MSSIPSHGRRGTFDAPSMTTGETRKLVDDHGVTYDFYTEVMTPHGEQQTAVYVYEAPVRLWHWVNALCILALGVTGYLIGQPLPSVGGEASAQYVMGGIRFVHFAAGQLLAVGFLGRIVWAMMGNHHSRQLFLLPVWSGRWWKEVMFELRWYLFLEKRPKKYIGHNPLAQIAMFFLFVLPLAAMIVTGMALYAEGMGQDHWTYKAFGWVIPLVGSSMTLHTVHRVGMWVILCFTMTHIYVAFREDIMSRQSIISTMVSAGGCSRTTRRAERQVPQPGFGGGPDDGAGCGTDARPGVGNVLWGDEGFGVRCAEAFAARYADHPALSVVDGGTQGLYLVDLFRDHGSVILFDAVDFGGEPGSLSVVRGEDVPTFVASGKVSLHQTGMQDVLATADLLGVKPERITLIGVQPIDMEDYGGSLTEAVRARIEEALELAEEELAVWGVALMCRQPGAAGLVPEALSLDRYEAERPPAEAACRFGDERVLLAAGE